MKTDKRLNGMLEGDEAPLVVLDEEFLTGTFTSERTKRVSSRVKRVTRTTRPVFHDLQVVFTDRRMIRFGSARQTPDKFKGRTIWELDRKAVESVPYTRMRSLEVSVDNAGGGTIVAKPYLFRRKAYAVGADSGAASGLPALERSAKRFTEGEEAPSEAEREVLEEAAKEYQGLALEKREAANKLSSAWWPVVGGFGCGAFGLLTSVYGALFFVYSLYVMLTGYKFAVERAFRGLVCQGPFLLAFGAGGVLGVTMALLRLRDFRTSRTRLAKVNDRIDALRAEHGDR